MGEIISGMDMHIVFWLILMILFVVAELVTVGLTSIWFAAGSLAALIAAIMGAGIGAQVVSCLVVSIALLCSTRSWAKKFVNSRVTRTNSDSLIGEVIIITERVSNLDQTGTAVVNGQEWTVRADDDKEVIEAGELARIVRITGVKLIVEKNKEE